MPGRWCPLFTVSFKKPVSARLRFLNMKVSIIIPVYNEEKTVRTVIDTVRSASFGFEAEREIIVVDDGSTDDTAGVLNGIEGIRVEQMKSNRGKGFAIKRGFECAMGDIVLIQDADLEYSPMDYSTLLEPFAAGKADVVFGSRFRGSYQRVLYFWHYLGNSFLTFLSNVFTNLNLSDMETGYKVFRKEVVDLIAPKLISKRFGIEPELTARVAHARSREGRRFRIYEVPISYYGRTYEEGKKIGWWDGIKAIGAILYFNLIDRA